MESFVTVRVDEFRLYRILFHLLDLITNHIHLDMNCRRMKTRRLALH